MSNLYKLKPYGDCYGDGYGYDDGNGYGSG